VVAIVVQLFDDCHIIEAILEGVKVNQEAMDAPNGHSKGFMGHVTRISNALNESAKVHGEVLERLDASEEWKEYVATALESTNQVESRTLGGGPRPTMEADESRELLEKMVFGMGEREVFSLASHAHNTIAKATLPGKTVSMHRLPQTFSRTVVRIHIHITSTHKHPHKSTYTSHPHTNIHIKHKHTHTHTHRHTHTQTYTSTYTKTQKNTEKHKKKLKKNRNKHTQRHKHTRIVDTALSSISFCVNLASFARTSATNSSTACRRDAPRGGDKTPDGVRRVSIGYTHTHTVTHSHTQHNISRSPPRIQTGHT